MPICEDFPCCGHTDGLGCDWVSPNEIVPCFICIEARKPSPYHDSNLGSCPTIRERAIAELVADAPCTFYSDAIDSCDGEYADTMHNGKPVCNDCLVECYQADKEMQEQYDASPYTTK
jgi:hypothetical protein